MCDLDHTAPGPPGRVESGGDRPIEEARVPKDLDERWYYNVDTRQVEKGPAKRGWLDNRLGPYDTREEAERGLEELHRRNEEMDEEDRRWEEG
jgi:hypothetical protein